ncbi:preflagellin peptidase FlaK [Halarchaeum solikamskense]|uniref:A24 family peptidase n=1 Tax=Halarchaeum nitratireducens TaxID=489913 RepID=UPI001B3AB452|nr:preflagellin peptidase FlaK [Halarchaeum solikamskense]
MYASVPDLLRLLAVPAFAYGAYRDIETRRVPDLLWPPLLVLGVLCLAVEGWNAVHAPDAFTFRAFALRTAVSVLLVGGLGAFFYVVPVGFGGADAKALVAISVLLPTYPTYYFDGFVLPHVPTTVRVFALTVLMNALVLGMAYPLYLLVSNAARGDIATVMAVGKRVPVERLPVEHGSLLEDREGTRLTGGLDLDALRMYCRWRGVTLADLRDDPGLRDPGTLPAEPNDPTDGVVMTSDGRARTDGGERDGRGAGDVVAGDGDPWGAAAFLDDIEGSAYGTSPASLREGLDVVTEREAVWITPGTPFFVTLCLGLIVAFTYGDLLFAALGALGLV